MPTHLSTLSRPGAVTDLIAAAARTLRYPGAPHGLLATHKDEFNADLLTFVRA